MRCDEPGYHNLTSPITVDNASVPQYFCPGKAAWSEDVRRLFVQCQVIAETGVLPEAGGLVDQSDMLTETLPIFLARWRERKYQRVWSDVREWTKLVLEAVLGKK